MQRLFSSTYHTKTLMQLPTRFAQSAFDGHDRLLIAQKWLCMRNQTLMTIDEGKQWFCRTAWQRDTQEGSPRSHVDALAFWWRSWIGVAIKFHHPGKHNHSPFTNKRLFWVWYWEQTPSCLWRCSYTCISKMWLTLIQNWVCITNMLAGLMLK